MQYLSFIGEDSYLLCTCSQTRSGHAGYFSVIIVFFEYDTTRFDEWLLLYYVT